MSSTSLILVFLDDDIYRACLIPPTLLADFRGMIWALRLALVAPRYAVAR